MTDVEIRKELLNGVRATLEYDHLQNRNPAQTTVSGIVHAYLAGIFSHRVLTERRVVDDLVNHVHRGMQTMLIGEAGAGKTSILMALNRRLKAESGDGDSRFDGSKTTYDLIAFNGNRHMARLLKIKDQEKRSVFIVNRIADAIDNRFFTSTENAIHPTWQLYVTREHARFKRFNTTYPTSDLSRLLETDASAKSEWDKCYKKYKKLDATERMGFMFDYLASVDHHVAIAIDNLDQHTTNVLNAAASAMFSIQSSTNMAICCIMSMRPSSVERVQRHIGFAHKDKVFAFPFERSDPAELAFDLNEIREMFRRRIAIFDDHVLLTKLANFLSQQFGTDDNPLTANDIRGSVKAELRYLQTVTDRVLEDYFSPDVDSQNQGSNPAPAVVRNDLTTLFTFWHNGSVRDLSVCIYDFVLKYVTATDSNGSDQFAHLWPAPAGTLIPDDIRQTRTALFRHVLFYHAPQTLESKQLSIHPSLQLFGSRGDSGLIELRILQYLNQKHVLKKRTSIGTVLDDLNASFNFSKKEIRGSIEVLLNRDGYESGLVRTELNDKTLEPSLKRKSHVEILPAGRILVDRISTLVEFLYWVAASHESSRTQLGDAMQIEASAFLEPDQYNSEQFRIETCITYLSDILLPLYARRLPFMLSGQRVSPVERNLLTDMCNQLGFTESSWFLSRCVAQVLGFARGNVVLGEEGTRRLDKINAATHQLTLAYHELNQT